jgi:predicted metal-binding protein
MIIAFDMQQKSSYLTTQITTIDTFHAVIKFLQKYLKISKKMLNNFFNVPQNIK